MQSLREPKKRSELRLKLGGYYYATRRKIAWLFLLKQFARKRQEIPLEHPAFSHRTPLLRKLKDVDMWMQHNKVQNLRLACEKLNGLVLAPGEVFSYWYLIGKPTARKGYLAGMVLQSGRFTSGVGGGLCQLSNLIFWMTLHTPLTVTERHRHGYDVFPDSNRTQPFGSGATCYYPYGDLMIRNDTPDTYQLFVRVGTEHLEGEWRVSRKPRVRFEIEERNHSMQSTAWGGYIRHNELYRLCYDENDTLINEESVVENNAIMMYSPLLETAQSSDCETQ